MRYLLILFILFSLKTNGIYSESVSLSKFESIEESANNELESLIFNKIKEELSKNNYKVELLSEEISIKNLELLKSKNINFHIGGFYKKKRNNPIEIYIQIYSTEKKVIIDSILTSYPTLSNIYLDSGEINRLDDITIQELSKKISIQLKLNSKAEIQDPGLPESLKNKPFTNKISQFIKNSEDDASKATFALMQGTYEVETASRTKESIFTSPATVVVITEEDIRERGYTDLAEILSDLPGFDIMHSNGAPYITPYMRGYRSYSGEKILLLIDGKEHRDMFNQIPRISRQFPLTVIKKIEVLYGPSSVVYGKDAMQGIINIITKNGTELSKDGNVTKVQVQAGSFQTTAVDTSSIGKSGKFSYAGSMKYFRSDEPDLSSRITPSFINNNKYSDRFTWGPVLNSDINGARFGRYYDPSLNQSLHANVTYNDVRVGIYKEKFSEGYGASYAGDRSQNNSTWGMDTTIFFLDYEKQISTKLRTLSKIFYKENAVSGTWTESLPSSKLSPPYNSIVSSTNWLAEGRGYSFYQMLEYEINKNTNFQWGINLNDRLISRSYDVPGYFNSFSSSLPNDPVRYPNGFSIVESSAGSLPISPLPIKGGHPANSSSYQDYGTNLIGNIDFSKIKFSGGVRYDRHSFYGSNVNPRITGIYKIKSNNSLKFMYGEAFNEPTQVQLYGDSGGGNFGDLAVDTYVGNNSLVPEKLKSSEIAYLYSGNNFYTEINSFYNTYKNSIELDVNSIYGKKIYGGEWKLNYIIKNPFSSKPFRLSANYTYTESFNSLTYFQSTKKAKNGTTILGSYEEYYNTVLFPDLGITLPRQEKFFSSGDIAKNKLNFAINIPVLKKLELNFRANYVGQRGLYTSNPLRNQGVMLDPFFMVNGTISYNMDEFGILSFKINNLFNEFVLEPGVELANSGNNYYNRSKGYRNSIIPTAGRNFLIVWTLEL